MDKIDVPRAEQVWEAYASGRDYALYATCALSARQFAPARQSPVDAQRKIAILEADNARFRIRLSRLEQKISPAQRYSCCNSAQFKARCRASTRKPLSQSRPEPSVQREALACLPLGAFSCGRQGDAIHSAQRRGSLERSAVSHGERTPELAPAARRKKFPNAALCVAGLAATLFCTLSIGSLMGWMPGSGRHEVEQVRHGAEATKPAAAKPMRQRRTLRVDIDSERFQPGYSALVLNDILPGTGRGDS